MGLITLVPLSNSSLDGYQPYGGETQPNTAPVQVAPLGQINAEKDFAYSKDISGSFSDPDGDPLTFSNPGNDLPAGLTVSSAGVISGTPTTPGGGTYTIRAQDPGGLFVDAQDSYAVTIASEIPLAPNWPNDFVIWNIRGWKDVFNDPVAQGYLAVCSLLIRQSLGIYTSSSRADTKAILDAWRASNPHAALLEHKNMLHLEINQPGGTNNAIWQWWNHVFPGGNFDHVIVSGNGNPNGRQSGVSMANSIRYAMAVGIDAVRQWWIDNVFYGNLSDNGDGNPANDGPNSLMHLQPGLVHDGLPDVLRKRFARLLFESTIHSRINARELRTNNTWGAAPTVGSPGGDGYFDLSESFFVSMLTPSKNNAAAVHVVGYKEVSGDGYFKTKNDIPSWVGSGDTAQIFNAKGDTRSADWSDPPDGNEEGQDSSERRVAILDILEKAQAATAPYGYTHGLNLNGVSGAGLSKRSGGGATYPNEFTGALETAQYESAEKDANFIALPDNSGYSGANATLDKLILDTNYGLTWIDKTGPVKQVRTKGVIVDCHTRDVPYNELTELDAAYFRWWLAYCRCTKFFSFGGLRGHSLQWPWTIEENFWLPGGDPDRSIVTYDPNGDGGKGSYVWDTPDFGERGYVRKFPNGWWLINMRLPDDPDPWIPHHMPGGQSTNPAKDTWTYESPGAGRKLVAFRGDGYTNPETLLTPHAGVLAGIFLGRDEDVNNGAEITGDLTIGPLEARLLEDIPA